MTEKDEFGDKLRDKQHAEEDRYFAQQEREKLEKLRAQTAKSPASVPCPHDAMGSAEHEHRGVKVDEQPTCAGIGLDRAPLEEVERKDEGWAPRWLRGILPGARR